MSGDDTKPREDSDLTLLWDAWDDETGPAANDTAAKPAAPPQAPRPPAEPLDPDLDVFDLGDDGDDETRIAEVPEELIATLQRLEDAPPPGDNTASTRPPPAEATGTAGHGAAAADPGATPVPPAPTAWDEDGLPDLRPDPTDEDDEATVVFSSDLPLDLEPADAPQPPSPGGPSWAPQAPAPLPAAPPIPGAVPAGQRPFRPSDPEIESAIADVLDEEWSDPALEDDLSDLAPPSDSPPAGTPTTRPPSAAPAPVPTPTSMAQRVDRVAQAARRTVRSRKPRVEHMPLVGEGPEVDSARRELLYELAQSTSGAQRASLFTQAGSIAEAQGDGLAAREAYEEARSVDAVAPEPLRALQRLAALDGDWAALFELLCAEAELPGLALAARAEASANAAFVALGHLQDPARALECADRALALQPGHLYAAALACRAHGVSQDAAARAAAGRLAELTSDPVLAASMHADVGAAAERDGQLETALEHYQKALESAPELADAWLGAARTAQALGQSDLAQRALGSLATSLPEGAARRAAERARARILALDLARPLEALVVLEQATEPVSLRERARWAQLADDPEPALQAWIEHTSGTERALASLELAGWYDARGRHAEAEQCLAQAREADGTLSLTRVVREVIARHAGGHDLAEAATASTEDAGTAMAAAARCAGDPAHLESEREWLDRAATRGGETTLGRVLGLDVDAEMDDAARVTEALARLAAHPEPEVTLAASLSLAERARRRGDDGARRTALQRALEAAPGEPLVLRAMGRSQDPPTERARWLQREASLGSGWRAASLHLARARISAEDERAQALRDALGAARDYVPARLACIASARRAGDLDALHALCLEAVEDVETDADADAGPKPSAVPWLVRAALIGAETDSDAAAELLVRAARIVPDDAILRVLVSRVGDALPAGLRAEMYGHGLDAQDDAPLLRARLLNAAGALEDAGRPQQALALYERVLQLAPDDALARRASVRLQRDAGRADAGLQAAREAVEVASAPLARIRALRHCARLALEAGDLEGASSFAQRGLATSPGDPECARIAERCVLARGDAPALLELQQRLLDASTGPLDRGARLRLIDTLLNEGVDAHLPPLNDTLCKLAERCAGGPWLARRLISAGRESAQSHAITAGWALMLGHAVTDAERATILSRLGERQPPHEAAVTDMLHGALQASPDHGIAAEHLAMRLERGGRHSEAAEVLEQAARSAASPARQVRLWHRAAVLWQDEVGSPERARASLSAAAELDVAYRDVSARLEGLLGDDRDLAGLIALTETRLSAGGSPAEVAELHRHLAELLEKSGNREAARQNLRAAHAVEPDDLATLRRLAELHERDRQFRECAETWILLARKLKEPRPLIEVFFKLGRLYDQQLPDETRAAAAYRRVLKLDPRHAPSLRALADLQRRQGQDDAAIDTLARLARAHTDPEARRDVVLELAQGLAAAERSHEAEQVLEELRKVRPHDLPVLAALAELYRKQAAGSALVMHTNRAAGDLRHAITEHIEDPNLWATLVEVLSWRGRPEAPRIVATTGVALGLEDPRVVGHALSPGALPGAGGGVMQPGVMDLLAPEGLSSSLRHVLAETADVLEKVMPFDPRAADGDKLPRKHPLRAASREIARWFGQSDADIWVSPRVPTAFLTVADGGPTFVVGRGIVDALTPPEQRFLLARAHAFAACKTSVVCRVSPDDLAILLHGLVRAFVEDHAPLGLDEATVENTAVRIQRVLPRRLREQLHDEVVEVGGAHDFDPISLYALCSRLASRMALVATGSVRGSLSALCRLAGSLEADGDPAQAILRTREARQLASFAISETHFEARRRAGADGG